MTHRPRFILLLLTVLSVVLSLNCAAQEAEKKPFFLPANPTAAAYVLGRLSNKELIEAPRSEFVFVALVQRKGLERKYRIEALAGLAKIRNTDALTELLGGLTELDKKGEDHASVLRDLSSILLAAKAEDLTPTRPLLEKLAADSQLALTRQIGYAAIVTADASIERPWKGTQANPEQLVDLLLAIPLIRASELRAALHPKVEPLLHQTDPAEVRRAAMIAIPAIPGHDAEIFNTLAALVKSGTERAIAAASLQRIPHNAWPKDQAASLVESLIAWLQAVPVEQRTEPEVATAFQFATDLTTLLPPDQAAACNRTLRTLGVSVFVVRTIPEQMLYDKTLIVVEAGKPAQIILINDDAMPHNLIVTMPGMLEEIGNLAEKMQPEPDAEGRLYVPDSPSVLYSTKMAEPGQQVKLSFTAPESPGDYPYVCTFPGHWRRMVGTLAVVKDVEAYLLANANKAAPKITEWKLADLSSDLDKVSARRNLTRGREIFTKLACAGCHKLGAEGVNYGPDLTGALKRFNNDRADVLRQILDPSLVISNRYRNIQFNLKDGEDLMGLILKEDSESVTVQTGPSDKLVQTLKKSDIKDQAPRTLSLMPMGLLNSLSKEEILDLLAWMESDGSSSTHEHGH